MERERHRVCERKREKVEEEEEEREREREREREGEGEGEEEKDDTYILHSFKNAPRSSIVSHISGDSEETPSPSIFVSFFGSIESASLPSIFSPEKEIEPKICEIARTALAFFITETVSSQSSHARCLSLPKWKWWERVAIFRFPARVPKVLRRIGSVSRTVE